MVLAQLGSQEVIHWKIKKLNFQKESLWKIFFSITPLEWGVSILVTLLSTKVQVRRFLFHYSHLFSRFLDSPG